MQHICTNILKIFSEALTGSQIRPHLCLTSVYCIKADDAHTSLFIQVLQLTLPVAA